MIFNFIVLIIYLVLTFKQTGLFLTAWENSFSPFVICPSFFLFILLRGGPRGIHWIFFVLAVNYAGDTAAYYTGRTWGRNKLAPAVSPKKTWEGSIGGLAANGLTAWIFQQTLFRTGFRRRDDSAGPTVGILSQFGDLLVKSDAQKGLPKSRTPENFFRVMEDSWTGWTVCRCRPPWFIFFFESDTDEFSGDRLKNHRPFRQHRFHWNASTGIGDNNFLTDRFRFADWWPGVNIALLQKQMENLQAPLGFGGWRRRQAVALQNCRVMSYTPDILWGLKGHDQIASMEEADLVVSALVGAVGLRPTLAAIRAGKDRGSGQQGNPGHGRSPGHGGSPPMGVTILPVDSEHSAIFQVLQGQRGIRSADHFDGFRRTLPGPFAGANGSDHPGRGLAAPELEDGTENFNRFGHPDEQGTGGHGGPMVIRNSLGTGRHYHPSPEHRSLAG